MSHQAVPAVQQAVSSAGAQCALPHTCTCCVRCTRRYCFYHETQNILGNTYGMCVLQDFEALTPNLLARTIETVEGVSKNACVAHPLLMCRAPYPRLS